MSNGDIFYVFGIALAVSAVLISLLGLRSEKFPGRAFPLVILWFAILVGGATTFAVLHGKDEEKAKEPELVKAGKEIELEESGAPRGVQPAQGGGQTPVQAKAKGPGGTLKLAASPTQLAFDTKSLSSKPGKVTIDFSNPSMLEHDVAIEQNGKQIAISKLIANGKTSVSANLAPGTYTFLCTVPGHAEAGMEGTLIIK
ncbi:MAG TPA: plastocyanin/azurin family copper-binding protein [Solirubrobacterales bacterium]|jgi:plastocyanin|nr:plastocyanin/azurin family copper-binding protein [Solirubrobacterales bacterium]